MKRTRVSLQNVSPPSAPRFLRLRLVPTPDLSFRAPSLPPTSSYYELRYFFRSFSWCINFSCIRLHLFAVRDCSPPASAYVGDNFRYFVIRGKPTLIPDNADYPARVFARYRSPRGFPRFPRVPWRTRLRDRRETILKCIWGLDEKATITVKHFAFTTFTRSTV